MQKVGNKGSLPIHWFFARKLIGAIAVNRCILSSSAKSIFDITSASSATSFKTVVIRNFVHFSVNNKMSEDSSNAQSYVAGSSSVAFVTTPDENSAKKLARGIIERKLAACVNIVPHIQSIYLWEGKLNEDNEYLMMIKTRTSRIDELAKWVRENHPYSVAEVISLPIENGNATYLDWIAKTVTEK